MGGGIKVVKFSLFSSTLFISYLKTTENVIGGAGVSYLCKFTTSRAPAASQITFSPSVVFLFPPQNSRKCRCGVLVVCSIHVHVQHLMHLRQSDLHVFSFFFHVPLQGSGKLNCGWRYRLSNSISSVLPFSFPTSKLRKM